MQNNIYLSLYWLVCLLLPMQLFAENGGYPGDDPIYVRPQVNSGANGPYQWRPLTGQRQSAADSGNDWQDSAGYPNQQYRDYTDTPFGLPRGSYRPVPQRHEITPHHQGYRFRPLRPSEQERIKQRNLANQGSRQPVGEPRFRPQRSTPEAGQFGYSNGKQYRFRPDERLDQGFSSDSTPFYTSEPNFKAPR